MGLCAIQAQTRIIEDLQAQKSDTEGIIKVVSDPAITDLLGSPGNQTNSQGNYDYFERTGYRIQVFMGNNPKTARGEATNKQTSIKSAFPDLATYLTYEAPNWKLSAGDFLTREEAAVFKQQLQKQFPEFGKEMYIIVDKVKIPVEKGE
ncbi:hypothetical protein AGMMS50262_22100 [Bacteroidia bacterium]|nr:hypothetical protein AGMMS50262_22100 [Bacteroidia bacterium]